MTMSARKTLVAGCCHPAGWTTKVVLGLLLCATSARAQIQTGITLAKDSVTVGEVVQLVVRVHAPLNAVISFPSAVDSLGPVQALEAPVVRAGSDSANAADRVATYLLSAWDVGQQKIKLGDVLVQTSAGDRRITLDLPTLFVKSVLPKDSAERVPKPARPLLDAIPQAPWWYWPVGAVLALLLGYIIWRFIARRRREAQGTKDPFIEAKHSFERVEKLRLLDAGEPGRHAALMADVVRQYLSARLTGVSLALTTQELLGALRGAPTISSQRLAALFNAVDPVKFARAPISVEAARSLGEDAKAIVLEERDRSAALAAAESTKTERAA